MDRLVAYHWSGNVRELENCLTRALVAATGEVIRPEHLGFGGLKAEGTTELGTLEAVEREHVARVLEATEGHKSRTAEILGISRPRLDRLIRRFDLSLSKGDRDED